MKERLDVLLVNNGFTDSREKAKRTIMAGLVTVDGEVCTVGSANFDIRSFRLNFESNAFIYDRDVTEDLDSRFMDDISLSRPYTQEDRDNISNLEKAAESISRLLTEIL